MAGADGSDNSTARCGICNGSGFLWEEYLTDACPLCMPSPHRCAGNCNVFVGEWDDEGVYLYQAFNAKIANWAVEHQRFGGPDFGTERMTWIKPSFAWVLYRAGYGFKDKDQTNILKIKLPHAAVAYILSRCQTAHSTKPNTVFLPEFWKGDDDRILEATGKPKEYVIIRDIPFLSRPEKNRKHEINRQWQKGDIVKGNMVGKAVWTKHGVENCADYGLDVPPTFGEIVTTKNLKKMKISRGLDEERLERLGAIKTEKWLEWVDASVRGGAPGRVQWDPSRCLEKGDKGEPAKCCGRAIQIGVRGQLSCYYVQNTISIEDVTSLAHQVCEAHRQGDIAKLGNQLPKERPYFPDIEDHVFDRLHMLDSSLASSDATHRPISSHICYLCGD
eukprot:TRINITY_DN75911_c0_g1_i1.p1 TRINITY_DN75911_c0_g1~~TRINITY_DN75911_c0_g1_i1.p1  ORF type:complete len:400 (-),score=45.98 TRINITY_DN75911_c0_g1_i1:101-1267(-)